MSLVKRSTILEYLNSISDQDLHWLSKKLRDRMCGDLAEVLNFLSKDKRVDSILSLSRNGPELFDMIDEIKDIVEQQWEERIGKHKKNKEKKAANT